MAVSKPIPMVSMIGAHEQGTETQDGRAGVVPERTVDVPAAGGNTHKSVSVQSPNARLQRRINDRCTRGRQRAGSIRRNP